MKDDFVIPDPKDMHVHVCSCGQVATTRFMTGQAWYERFEKELNMPPQIEFKKTGTVITIDYRAAAKRAAGME